MIHLLMAAVFLLGASAFAQLPKQGDPEKRGIDGIPTMPWAQPPATSRASVNSPCR